jgi:hypothetical protein
MTMIPTSYKNAEEMLATLVTYLKDDAAVQRSVLAEFGWKPSGRQIARARLAHKHRTERYRRTKWDKGGNGENDKLLWEDMKTGSKRLRERIIARHPNIMKALEARGNTVVWNG